MLTFFSLSTWAVEELSNSTPGLEIAVADRGYGGADLVPATDIRITLDGGEISTSYWEIEGYYNTQVGEKKAHVAGLSVGEHRFVKINFKGVYSGFVWGEFEVTKGVIKVTVKNAAYFTRAYRSSNPATGIAIGDLTVTLNNAAVDASDYVNVAASAKYTTNATVASPVGDYTLSFSGITLKDDLNYDLTWADQKFVVEAASIVTGGKFTFNTDYTAAYTYSATKQTPTFGITWDDDNDAGTDDIDLTASDYDIVYKKGGDVVANPTDAGTYNVFVVGKGNYKTAGTGIAVAALDFEIAKAPLTVMALPKEKEFDGQPFVIGTAQFNVSGRVGADASKAVTLLAATEVDAFSKNVASYTVGVNTASAKIGDDLMSKNYTITPVEVEWEITQKDMTIAVANVEMAVGSADYPDLTDEAIGKVTVTGAVDNTDKTAAAAAYVAALDYATADGEPLDVATYATSDLVPVGTYANAVKVTGTPAFAGSTNYNITVTKGSLIVKGLDFDVMPVIASDIEYGDAYTIGYYTDGTIDETKLVFKIGETEYAYKDKATWKLPTAVDNYVVTIKEGTAIGIEGSTGGEANPLSSSFNIIPRKLTLTVKNQTVHKNDPITILDELVAGHEGADGITIAEDLAFDDEIADLNLTYSLDGDVVTIAGGKITAVAADYANAILVALGNTNYQIAGGVYTKGALTVSEEYTADLAAATAAATITEAAANGSKYDVTISGRTLTANTWNVMVLPFAVKPYDFCNTIGNYAVFNRLQKVETDAEGDAVKDKIYFKLEMSEIPANEPFLVKPLEDVDFDHMDDNGTPANPADDFKDIIFQDVTFVNAEPIYIGVTGATFTGTYENATDINSTNWWGMQKGQFKHFSAAKAGALKFTRAFIELTSGASAAEFFVEDIDINTNTTAIKSLNLDTMKSVDMKGWYTVGGVKLQGAPTQKGVYINNGKKVVIK